MQTKQYVPIIHTCKWICNKMYTYTYTNLYGLYVHNIIVNITVNIIQLLKIKKLKW